MKLFLLLDFSFRFASHTLLIALARSLSFLSYYLRCFTQCRTTSFQRFFVRRIFIIKFLVITVVFVVVGVAIITVLNEC